LAPIDIKPFSGHYTEWLPFFNTFRALVHDDPRYQNRNLEKLHQLRNCLRGEALEVIQALPISAENYETALSSLRSQFENKRLIVQHHVNNLFNLPQVSKDSARSLRLLVNTVNTNLDALNSLDINTNHFMGSAIDTHNHIAVRSRHKWEESLKTTEPQSKAQLITHLTQRCNLLEALEINKNLSKMVPTTRDNDQKAGNKNSTKSFAVQDNKVRYGF
jgi:diadenosine tetraphosphate (Ap4A) HIT family hydrolase